MNGSTKGEDVLNTFIKHFEQRNIDIKKMFSITTDGAPAMVGIHRRFVTLAEQMIGHPVMKLHWIIHQENLCAKISDSELNDVMSTVTKIVNFLVARSAKTHRQFRSLLEEMGSAYHDVPLHCSVRWLSRGKVLWRFVECLVEIKIFLATQKQTYPELEDEKWLAKLMFLVDITAHLNELNLRLQGSGQTVICLFEEWKGFISKLDVYTRDIQTASFLYFKHLKAFSVDHQVNTVEIEMCMRNLRSRFCSRFQDFQHFGSLFSFLIKPESSENLNLTAFEWMNVEDFEMQLIDLKASLLWTSKFSDLRKSLETVENKQKSILTCWESLPEKFSCLKKMAIGLLSSFGSTYLCEQIFSHTKYVLGPHRTD